MEPNTLLPVILILFAAAVVFIVVQANRMKTLRDAIKQIEDTREQKKLEAENARKETRERRDELDRVKKELLDAKARLKKQEDAPSASSVPGVVSEKSDRPGKK